MDLKANLHQYLIHSLLNLKVSLTYLMHFLF